MSVPDWLLAAPSLAVPSLAGLHSRARSRAQLRRRAAIWSNRALSAIRQLARGTLSDELLSTADDAWQGVDNAQLHSVSATVLDGMERALQGRPPDCPVGVAAIQRQLGAESSSSRDSEKRDALPKRGQIWPAQVEAISLPPPGSGLVPLLASPRCAQFLQEPFTRMLLPPADLEVILAEAALDPPYVDPVLRSQMPDLAMRMAKGGMLQGLAHARAEVGLFTVVKKAERSPSGEALITLRLVFDQRVPNKLWTPPPWVPLAGPGAFSAIDLAPALLASPGAKLGISIGDVPSYYYGLELPLSLLSFSRCRTSI